MFFPAFMDADAERRTPLSLPDDARLVRHHGLSFMASEGFAELVEILHGAVHPEHPWRMGIGAGGDAGRFVGDVLTPDLGVGDEEALGRSVAVDFLRLGVTSLAGEDAHEGLISDAKAAVIGGVFTERELAVQLLSGNGLEAAVLVDLATGALLKSGAVRRGPPVLNVALGIELAPLVVEAVRHFMADDHADGSEIDGRVLGIVEERRLQDAGGKVDVVVAGT